ncbi:MAG: hypothetical protein IKR68_02375 [Lachnospiraceae bacterium]|nr:hypothetical protein [Lachnospiraceae bacterium]
MKNTTCINLKQFKKRAIALLLTLAMCLSLCACALIPGSKEDEDSPIGKILIPREAISIGCFISEEYFYFQDELFATAAELEEMGLISGFDINAEYKSTQEVWDALCNTRSTGDPTTYIFSKNDFYNLTEMSEADIDAMTGNSSLSLMITLGTAAGKVLTDRADTFSFDYMVFGATDPISSGIVPGPNERFNDHSFAEVDTRRITRQIEGAYELFEFKNIGVVYEDSAAAYSYSGIGQLEAAAAEHGFVIHTRHVNESAGPEDDDRYYTELKKAYDDLQDEIDALYITTATIDSEMLPTLLADLHEAGVITIAESSEDQVENGALMHISLADASQDGEFVAHCLEKYASGESISKMDQVFDFSPGIVFNRETIEKTGVVLPLEVYLVADRIYPEKEDR